MFSVIVKLFLTMILSAVITPFVIKLAYILGAVDNPNARRVNKKPMPTMGGLAIFIAFTFSTFVLLRNQFPSHELFSVFLAEVIIILTGIIDDIRELSPKAKMAGIFVASLVIYFLAGIRMNEIVVPYLGTFQLGWWSFPITIIWILAITNAVNLIDGLDGLATGVSIIALFTMGIVGYFFLNLTNVYVSIWVFALVAALVGFLPHNFHPASIFLGDTGALFIGFMIAVFSLKGLKNVTFVTMLIPVVILGVPITDTVYAMLRRFLNKKPITQADKHHLHHRLMQLGLSHRQTVLVIYGLALVFAFISLLLPLSNFWGSLLLAVALLIGLELFVESIGLIGDNRQPLLHAIQKFIKRLEKNNQNKK
ncbi:glycosyltransferase family 4 protein [Companilactobacillus sp.]|jgi:UDP-GlcNAc:undecaprenyl-phosphate GlcNAc-1-phosphate transferase|uniref:glycosyltransferase family 4 protein n=1 Tax=Companilactobacillus sp. TaxID=2767905 RepID=UPI0025BADF68|nr:MraY family glycosyltransferase [Companilactobacillus sp.]MCH4008808.1 undecaprenyl/decaprenyl-phosphate alpha-N-acetylglucosaminyl 1-phosphate transferase [Companilactobacillus sp.]MCH4051013.1 undecaprenyl/decaprenyl-phosphate alpha-N-acetylglucosaminyl 1-phosphate transferase [Companilactobacillus sp.]MCH4076751.1 undecaprenyl/decaprenyl-phosphate alpha-N-acetylglucosaminyl 1-phosphate transferase [Companilactobacillus sp.]MCH4125326.1 undecaprenyl/decaprenyl-phosphate alpha-N-acetylgluco